MNTKVKMMIKLNTKEPRNIRPIEKKYNEDDKVKMMIKFLHPDFFEIDPADMTTNQQTETESIDSVDGGLLDHLDNILEDTFFCFKKNLNSYEDPAPAGYAGLTHENLGLDAAATTRNLPLMDMGDNPVVAGKLQKKFKIMFRDMLKEFFTIDIHLHTMMNLLYDFLFTLNYKRYERNNLKKNIIYFFPFMLMKKVHDNKELNYINIFKTSFKRKDNYIQEKILFLITKIPNLFDILKYYQSILIDNYMEQKLNDRLHNNKQESHYGVVDKDIYIYELLNYAMNKIINNFNPVDSTITTNQYEEYLQLKFTEFINANLRKIPFNDLKGKNILLSNKNKLLTHEVIRLTMKNVELRNKFLNRTKKIVFKKMSIDDKRSGEKRVFDENPLRRIVTVDKKTERPKVQGPQEVQGQSEESSETASKSSETTSKKIKKTKKTLNFPLVSHKGGASQSFSINKSTSTNNKNKTLFIELFEILGRAITDNDYEQDSNHDELLPGTANEDKAIEQCDAFDFIIEKSQFCISDIDYKIKENQDEMIEIFDDSIMIYDAGAGIILPLKYDPWLSRQKGQDNSRRKHVHPLQHQSYDFVCSRLKNDEPSSKSLSSSFDAATGGTGLGACLRQLMLHFSGSMDSKQFEDIYQKFYECLFAFVESTITEQYRTAAAAAASAGLYSYLTEALNILRGIKIVGVMLNGNINCEYNKIQFKWSSSQSLMAAYINIVVRIHPAKPRTDIKIDDEFNKNHFLDHLKDDTQITNKTFHHVCRLMKYMGDKAHIACALFLHLYSMPLPPQSISEVDRYEPDK